MEFTVLCLGPHSLVALEIRLDGAYLLEKCL
jgi:hypothetical protein